MWFLILQILFLLLLAALLGAALMFWWIRGRYEDVTETYSAFMNSPRSAASDGSLQVMHDRLEGIESRLSTLRFPDLDPVDRQLNAIAGQISGYRPADLSPVYERLSRIEDHLTQPGQQLDLSPVEAKLDSVEHQINNLAEPDLAPVLQRLHDLELGLSDQGNVDLSPVLTSLAALQGDVKNADGQSGQLLEFNQRLAHMESEMVEALQSALEKIHARLDALSSNDSQTFVQLEGKFSDVDRRVAALMERFSEFDRGLASRLPVPKEVDLNPIHAGLAEAKYALSAYSEDLKALKPIENSLSDIKETVFKLGDKDLIALLDSIKKMESRLNLAGVETRLTSIEYGLAATHHMLRARFSETPHLTDPPQQEPYRSGPESESLFTTTTELRVPEDSLDPIDVIRHPDGKASRLLEPGFGDPDNLDEIFGVGSIIQKKLNDAGIYYFWQIADWSKTDIEFLDKTLLSGRGQIQREDWVSQAKKLLAKSGSAQRPRPLNQTGLQGSSDT